MAIDETRADDRIRAGDDGGVCHIGVASDIGDAAVFDDDAAAVPGIIQSQNIAAKDVFGRAAAADFACIAAADRQFAA